MNARLSHLAGPLSGLLGTGLTFAGLMVANSATADLSPDLPATSIATTYATRRGDIRFGVSLVLLGIVLSLWFVAYLAGSIRAAGGSATGSAVLGGGILALAGVVVNLALLVAATTTSIVTAPSTAQTLLILQWEIGGLLAPAFAVLVGAASIAVLGRRIGGRATRPVAWLGAPLALALASSGFTGGALAVVALVWLFLLAVTLVLSAPGNGRVPVVRTKERSSLR
jgi:hypothetical protein